MLHEELDKLRLALALLVLASFVYGSWIDPSAICSDRALLYEVWQDCPTIQDELWFGCVGFLLGPFLAKVLWIQGWICYAVMPLLVGLALYAPGPGRRIRHQILIPGERLYAMLHGESPRDDRVPTHFGPGKLLVGQPKEAATGMFGFIGCNEDALRLRMARGVAAIVEEAAALGDEVLSECLNYVLHERAGSSERAFQNGWLRDRAPDGSELLGRHGMTLADFCALDVALDAQLSEGHVVALRLYSTAAFAAINQPMRNLKTRRARAGEKVGADGRVPIEPPQLLEPHPLPVTMVFIYEGLKRMRAVSAGVHEPASHRSEVDGPTQTLLNEPSDVWLEPVPLPMPALPLRTPQSLHPREYFAGVSITPAGADGGDPPPELPTRNSLAIAEPSGDRGDTASGWVAGVWRTMRSRTGSLCGRIGQMCSPSSGAPGKADGGGTRSPWRHRMWALRPRTLQLRPPGRPPARRANDVILWRGMKNSHATKAFMRRSGTELAPMSTTTDLDIAVRYAREDRGGESLLFRIRSNTFMNLGCDLTVFSAFPHEREALYPPLTYLQPTGKVHVLNYGGCRFTVIDVEPSFPS
jgi:hypothetical protein